MRTTVLRYSGIQCLYWVNYAIVSGNASVYLRSQGLPDTVIGAVIAVAGLGSALMQPRAAAMAQRDRTHGLHRVALSLLAVFCLSAAGVMLLFGRSPAATAVAWCLCVLMIQSLLPLINSLAVTTGVPFGGPRAAGSVGYAVIILAMGQAVPRIGTYILPGSMLIVFLIEMILILYYPHPEPLPVPSQQEDWKASGGPFLRRHPELALLAAGSVGLYMSHAVVNTFAIQIVNAKGGGEAEMGIGSAIAALVELPVMFGFFRINRRFSTRSLMAVSGVFFTLKSLFTLLSPSITAYYLTQLLQMPAFALSAVASVQYITETIPPEDTVKGQSWYTMSITVGTVIGAQLGGLICNLWGADAMMTVTTILAALGSAVVIAAMRGKKAQ